LILLQLFHQQQNIKTTLIEEFPEINTFDELIQYKNQQATKLKEKRLLFGKNANKNDRMRAENEGYDWNKIIHHRVETNLLSEENMYSKLLQQILPDISDIILHFSGQLTNSLSTFAMSKLLEPFNLYQENINFTKQLLIDKIIKDKILWNKIS